MPGPEFPRLFIRSGREGLSLPPEQIHALARRDVVALSPFRGIYRDIAAIRQLNPRVVVLQDVDEPLAAPCSDPAWRRAFDGFFLHASPEPPAVVDLDRAPWEPAARLMAQRLHDRCGAGLAVGHAPPTPFDAGPPGAGDGYRPMRFGLAAALLDDGYYQYLADAAGWFDEYGVDAAGKPTGGETGRHWLGRPLGPARQIVEPLAAPDRMERADWEVRVGSPAVIDLDQQGDALRVEIGAVRAPRPNAVVLRARGRGPVSASAEYTLVLDARAFTARLIDVVFAGARGFLYLQPQWARHVLTLCARQSAASFDLRFELGRDDGWVELQEVRLQEGAAEAGWTREFEHGLTAVNPTRRARVLEIPPGFRKILGAQDPAHNDGKAAGPRLEIGPLDAYLLCSGQGICVVTRTWAGDSKMKFTPGGV